METEPETSSPDGDADEAAKEVVGKASWLKQLRAFLLSSRFLFGVAIGFGYLLGGILALVGGVGWHYLDKSLVYDVAAVERLDIGAIVFDRNGKRIGRVGAEDRSLIQRENLPDHLVEALLAAEDQRFFFHIGVDPMGTLRAALANLKADSIQEGGSTLTQQLARDVFALEERSIERKLTEMAIALRLEAAYSKDEILVHYLNRIYFGSGFYGIGRAAKGFFDKEVTDLSVGESAMLCGLIRLPSRLSPFVNREKATAARNRTLERMRNFRYLSKADYEEALASKTEVAKHRDDRIDRGQIEFLLRRVEREGRPLLGDRSFDGLVIRLSVDLEEQQRVARIIDQYVTELAKEKQIEEGLEGAAIVIENSTGNLLLSVGSRDFYTSEYDRSVDMKRPPGSAFFPFVYAAAFESGKLAPTALVLDAPVDNRKMMLGGTTRGILGEWSTENPANRWEGLIPASTALRLSKNSPTARVGSILGSEGLTAFASRLGIASPLRALPSSFLGASEVSLLEMVNGYAVLANRGKSQPRATDLIRHILDDAGASVSIGADETAEQLISEETVDAITEALGTTSDKRLVEKSGTVPGFTDTWHYGFNQDYTWGVWVGSDSFKPLGSAVFGKEIARPLAKRVLESFVALPETTQVSPGQLTQRDSSAGAESVAAGDSGPLIGDDPYGTMSGLLVDRPSEAQSD